MKPKLQIFTQFIQSLLPLEIRYLCDKIPTDDPDFKRILKSIQDKPNLPRLDLDIDKRKYSALKSLMQKELQSADVDSELMELQDFENKILADKISPEEEKRLLKKMKNYQSSHYNFMKFYGLMMHFRQYLLIRLRRRMYPEVHQWLQNHENQYQKSLEVYASLHDTTAEIVAEYDLSQQLSTHYMQKLLDIYHHDPLDAQNRYAAVVRLWFAYMNQGDYKGMQALIQEVEYNFLGKNLLGRRILVNFYANKLLLCSKLDQLEEAELCGYHSLREKNNDYLFYLNNLSSVLLRRGKAKEALRLMKEAFTDMRSTVNLHNKMSFIAHYVHCLIDLGKANDAEDFAENYLGSHLKEVMSNRWHLFFTAYFRSLVMQEKFGRLLFLVSKYKIKEKENQYMGRRHYLPTVSWYIIMAEFMEGEIHEEKALSRMKAAALTLVDDPIRKNRIQEQIAKLKNQQPSMMAQLERDLQLFY